MTALPNDCTAIQLSVCGDQSPKAGLSLQLTMCGDHNPMVGLFLKLTVCGDQSQAAGLFRSLLKQCMDIKVQWSDFHKDKKCVEIKTK